MPYRRRMHLFLGTSAVLFAVLGDSTDFWTALCGVILYWLFVLWVYTESWPYRIRWRKPCYVVPQ